MKYLKTFLPAAVLLSLTPSCFAKDHGKAIVISKQTPSEMTIELRDFPTDPCPGESRFPFGKDSIAVTVLARKYEIREPSYHLIVKVLAELPIDVHKGDVAEIVIDGQVLRPVAEEDARTAPFEPTAFSQAFRGRGTNNLIHETMVYTLTREDMKVIAATRERLELHVTGIRATKACILSKRMDSFREFESLVVTEPTHRPSI